MKANKKERVVVITNSPEYDNVELKDILDKITRELLEEMYGKIVETNKKQAD